jgi:hypothetical protein
MCAALALAAWACGGTATTEGNSSGSGGGGVGGGGVGGGSSTLCSATPPADGSACTPPSDNTFNDRAHCSWGDDPRPQCRTTAKCNSDNVWVITTPNPASCTAPPLPAACGTTPSTAGSTCTDTALACWYDDGQRCWCSDCQGGSQYPVCQTIDPPEWACDSRPAGCPSAIPQAGDSCSEEGLSCGPDCELHVVCEDGAWVWRNGDCPICASPTTPIATPSGDVAIAQLRVGDLVYSVDGAAIVAVPILRIGSTPVTRHQVMRVALASGAVLEISPGHPTADGRTFGELRVGGALDGQAIIASELVAYTHTRTHDILPNSETGTYVAAGALIGSTITR